MKAKFCRVVPLRRLQTPIRTFRHQQSGRTMTVIGTNTSAHPAITSVCSTPSRCCNKPARPSTSNAPNRPPAKTAARTLW